MAKTFQFDQFAPQQNPNCAACEEMLIDAIDGVLSPADQAFFDLHLAGCTSCMDLYTDAKRGAVWLDILKTHRPEPSGALMERILSQTSSAGFDLATSNLAGSTLDNQAAFDNHATFLPELTPLPLNVLPFIPRQAPVSRFTRFTRLAMEPRFAMTAAMAFFSIALTLNLTGVRFDQIRTADLKPSNLKRSYYEANASAVRYYDNLRVVRVLESRVEDIRQNNAADRPSHPAPESQPENQPAPKQQQSPDKKQAVPQGSSRRESPLPKSPTVLNATYTSTPDRLRRDAISPLTPNTFKKEGGLA